MIHHANDDNPSRCLVAIFKTYISHCPVERKSDALYFTPLKKPKSDCWYSNIPFGHNTLSRTVRQLCDSAGIDGYKTNHSLRVSNATRLFQSGVDEQLIMSRTGHRSVEGVRAYKRISGDQKLQLSDFLNKATNGLTYPSKVPATLIKEPTAIADTTIVERQNQSSANMQFNNCSSVTINYTYAQPATSSSIQ